MPQITPRPAADYRFDVLLIDSHRRVTRIVEIGVSAVDAVTAVKQFNASGQRAVCYLKGSYKLGDVVPRVK